MQLAIGLILLVVIGLVAFVVVRCVVEDPFNIACRAEAMDSFERQVRERTADVQVLAHDDRSAVVKVEILLDGKPGVAYGSINYETCRADSIRKVLESD